MILISRNGAEGSSFCCLAIDFNLVERRRKQSVGSPNYNDSDKDKGYDAKSICGVVDGGMVAQAGEGVKRYGPSRYVAV